jgi:hypothetical protein
MNAQEFRQEVMKQERPGLSKISLSVAADFFVSEGWIKRADISACIQLAGRLEVAYPLMSIETAVTAASPISISP